MFPEELTEFIEALLIAPDSGNAYIFSDWIQNQPFFLAPLHNTQAITVIPL
jgi:hypothetical protein